MIWAGVSWMVRGRRPGDTGPPERWPQAFAWCIAVAWLAYCAYSWGVKGLGPGAPVLLALLVVGIRASVRTVRHLPRPPVS